MHEYYNFNDREGFTLIELLIVIAIIAILAGVVFVALDPLTRFQEARDSTRWSDVTSVAQALKVDQVDNEGSYLTAVEDMATGTPMMIGTGSGGGDCTATTTNSHVDLTGLVDEGYLSEVPKDPQSGTDSETDYYLKKDSTGVITVGACEPEAESSISVSK